MKFLAREVRNAGHRAPLSYYHAHWTHDGAPLLDELGAVIDHVEAHSTGGLDSEDNLATSCNKCNAQKSDAARVKWDKRPKRKPVKGKYGEPQHWDGLSRVFVILAQRDPAHRPRRDHLTTAKAMALGDIPTTTGVPGWLFEVRMGVSRLIPPVT
jgi:hypothetical protein